jgi:homoserine dehydrogenase
MKSVRVGILGLGTVGSGVYELLKRNADLIKMKTGISVEVKKCADINPEKKKKLGIPDWCFTSSAEELVEDPAIDIVVELIGGTGVALDLVLGALSKKKHVVTANKALLATHLREIFQSVLENRVELGFEGSVGGGIPIIKTIREALVGNQINRIVGILNGTTNFILTKMTREGLDFQTALRIAQELGFAEADPTLDISGGDSRHKITILSSLAFNTFVEMESVYVEGIENIERRDLVYAGELGFVLKLLAIAEKKDEGISVKVHPALISRENPLAAINWEDNAIMVYSDFLGKSMYSGKGAGAKPTASAIVADIVDIALRTKNGKAYTENPYAFSQSFNPVPFDRNRSRFYFRFHVLDRPGILSKIAGILGDNNISIASVIQKESEEEHEYVPLVMMTHTALEADVIKAIKLIDRLPELEGKTRLIRVIDEE